ncbi:MAG: peptide deformylase [Deltaproteobacteria bacterium]|jgi:peptide deformylase|nr:peptide deformylase [Deltaproteobacteria bacterium]
MAILPILKYPDPLLLEVSEPVTEFDESLKKLSSDMIDTLKDAPGAGLAAPQIGKRIRLIVMDNSSLEDEQYNDVITLVNPVIVHAEGKQVYMEGCLSVEDLQSNVNRYLRVKVDYQDLYGNPKTIEASERRAVILQHEIDHLDGVLFLDHLSPLKRELYIKRMRKQAKKPQKS